MYIFQPDRYLLKQQVKKLSHYIKDRVVDVGAGKVDRYSHFFNYDEYVRMDIKKSETIDVVGDLLDMPFEDKSFNSIVCTGILGDIKDLHQAIQEFYRILKPGGTVLVTETFMTESHNEPYDYWRFTKFGFEYLFENNGFKIIIIDQRGGFFSTKAQNNIRYLINRFNLHDHNWARIVNPFFKFYSHFMFFLDKIDNSQTNRKFTIGWCVIAQKCKK